MLSFEKAVGSGISWYHCYVLQSNWSARSQSVVLPPFKDPPTVMFDHSWAAQLEANPESAVPHSRRSSVSEAVSAMSGTVSSGSEPQILCQWKSLQQLADYFSIVLEHGLWYIAVSLTFFRRLADEDTALGGRWVARSLASLIIDSEWQWYKLISGIIASQKLQCHISHFVSL